MVSDVQRRRRWLRPHADLFLLGLCLCCPVFVHQTAVQSSGFRFLKDGERVSYDLTETDRGVQALNVTDPEGQPLDRAQDEFYA